MKNFQNEPWYPVYQELQKNKEANQKYFGKAGCYKILIDGILVYIGKSKDFLQRLAMYLYYSQNPEQHTCRTYKIYNQALVLGHQVDFKVCYYSSLLDNKKLEDDIGFKEGQLIRENLPPLNYQIPKEEDYRKFTINKKAKTITLEEILNQGNSSKFDYIKY